LVCWETHSDLRHFGCVFEWQMFGVGEVSCFRRAGQLDSTLVHVGMVGSEVRGARAEETTGA